MTRSFFFTFTLFLLCLLLTICSLLGMVLTLLLPGTALLFSWVLAPFFASLTLILAPLAASLRQEGPRKVRVRIYR